MAKTYETDADFLADELKKLNGKRIKQVVAVDVGGDHWPGIVLEDDSLLLIQRDPEGNGGGWIEHVAKEGVAL